MAYYKNDFIGLYNGLQNPSVSHNVDNETTMYFVNFLWERCLSRFKITVPEWWESDYFLDCLLGFGFIGVADFQQYGVLCQHGTLNGRNVFYHPKTFMVANPQLKQVTGTFEIGEDCTIIKLMPDYENVIPAIQYHAVLMAKCLESMHSNLVNTETGVVFMAENKADAETFKKTYDRLHSGEPMVAVTKSLYDDQGNPKWQLLQNDIGNLFICNDLMEYMQKVLQQFDEFMGFENLNGVEKKERLTTGEVETGTNTTRSKAQLMLETIQSGMNESMIMFPELKGKLSVELAGGGTDADNFIH